MYMYIHTCMHTQAHTDSPNTLYTSIPHRWKDATGKHRCCKILFIASRDILPGVCVCMYVYMHACVVCARVYLTHTLQSVNSQTNQLCINHTIRIEHSNDFRICILVMSYFDINTCRNSQNLPRGVNLLL